MYLKVTNMDSVPLYFTGTVLFAGDKIPFINGRTGCFSTVLYLYCMDCKKFLGTKNGHSVFGDTSGLCESCFNIRMEES